MMYTILFKIRLDEQKSGHNVYFIIFNSSTRNKIYTKLTKTLKSEKFGQLAMSFSQR